MLIGNLKMNILSKKERDSYFQRFKLALKKNKNNSETIVLCVPAIHLESFVKNVKNKKVFFGGQNIYWKEEGAWTGEMSAKMVKNFGGKYVLIGHSERRKYFNESNEDVNKKLKVALKNKLTPILCIGENINERQRGETKQVILRQLLEGLSDIEKEDIQKMIIAYEPVWAIGTGKIPTSEDIMIVKILVKKILSENLDIIEKNLPKILYGGSVNYRNAKEVWQESGMDGVLVGGESLHPIDFLKICSAKYLK